MSKPMASSHAVHRAPPVRPSNSQRSVAVAGRTVRCRLPGQCWRCCRLAGAHQAEAWTTCRRATNRGRTEHRLVHHPHMNRQQLGVARRLTYQPWQAIRVTPVGFPTQFGKTRGPDLGRLSDGASLSAPVPLRCEVGFPAARPHARVGEPFGFLSGRVSGFALVEHHRTGFIPLADTAPLGDPTGDLPLSGFGAGFGELSGFGDGEYAFRLAYRIQRVQPRHQVDCLTSR